MASCVEWYLDQLSEVELVDDCTDPVLRGRIHGYIDFMVAQSGPSHVSREVKRRILNEYLFSREGRGRYVIAVAKPARVRYEHYRGILETRSQFFDWTWNKYLKNLEGFTIEHENFFSILPDDERFTPAVCDLRDVVALEYLLYQQAIEACASLDRDAQIRGTGVAAFDQLSFGAPPDSP